MITKLPRPDEMCCGEQRTKDEAQSPNNNVSNTKEVVLTTDHSAGRKENRLGASKFRDIEVCQSVSIVRQAIQHTSIPS